MDITEPVQLALVVAVPTFVAPIILLFANRMLDRGDRRRQYEREDEVRRQVEIVAEKTAARDRVAVADSNEIKAQVRAVHTLVNSDKTAQMEANLAALEGQLAALLRLEVVGKRLNPPVDATEEERMLINSLRTRCDSMRLTLVKREEQTKLAEAQIKRAEMQTTSAGDQRTADATERVAYETKRVADAAEKK